MVAINIVSSQDKELAEWRKKGGYTFPVLVCGPTFARDAYGVSAAPTNVLLDTDHRTAFRHLGYGPGAEKRMEAEIRELLGLDPFEGTEN